MRSLVLASVVLASSLAAQRTECRFKDYRDSCGPSFTGSHTSQGASGTITLTVSKGLPNEMALLVIGTRETRIPIPVYGCFLLTNPVFITHFPLNANGVGRFETRVPPKYEATIFAQAAVFSLSPPRVSPSHGLEIRCRQR